MLFRMLRFGPLGRHADTQLRESGSQADVVRDAVAAATARIVGTVHPLASGSSDDEVLNDPLRIVHDAGLAIRVRLRSDFSGTVRREVAVNCGAVVATWTTLGSVCRLVFHVPISVLAPLGTIGLLLSVAVTVWATIAWLAKDRLDAPQRRKPEVARNGDETISDIDIIRKIEKVDQDSAELHRIGL